VVRAQRTWNTTCIPSSKQASLEKRSSKDTITKGTHLGPGHRCAPIVDVASRGPLWLQGIVSLEADILFAILIICCDVVRANGGAPPGRPMCPSVENVCRPAAARAPVRAGSQRYQPDEAELVAYYAGQLPSERERERRTQDSNAPELQKHGQAPAHEMLTHHPCSGIRRKSHPLAAPRDSRVPPKKTGLAFLGGSLPGGGVSQVIPSTILDTKYCYDATRPHLHIHFRAFQRVSNRGGRRTDPSGLWPLVVESRRYVAGGEVDRRARDASGDLETR
jgi:hypothetical protein